jgi:pre-mRNA-processing factor SLU7
MSHKSVDCLERPRAQGAKWTGKHIAADDKIHEVQVGVAWVVGGLLALTHGVKPPCGALGAASLAHPNPALTHLPAMHTSPTHPQLVGYDSKRDRWNGYEPGEYSKVVSRYEAVEALRSELKLKEQVEALYAQVSRVEGHGARMAATLLLLLLQHRQPSAPRMCRLCFGCQPARCPSHTPVLPITPRPNHLLPPPSTGQGG